MDRYSRFLGPPKWKVDLYRLLRPYIDSPLHHHVCGYCHLYKHSHGKTFRIFSEVNTILLAVLASNALEYIQWTLASRKFGASLPALLSLDNLEEQGL